MMKREHRIEEKEKPRKTAEVEKDGENTCMGAPWRQ